MSDIQQHGIGLLEGEPAPTVIDNRVGPARVVVVCEHAGKALPKALGTLGLGEADRNGHIAWDIGAGPLAAELARLLGAPYVHQRYSRLAYDCNRPPEAPDAIVPVSDGIVVPGNTGLDDARRRDRIVAIYDPFHAALGDLLDARSDPVIVTVHSFTRIFEGLRRDVDIGILHDDDARLADALLAQVARWEGLDVRRNAPYGPADGVTHTLIRHGVRHGRLNVMLEIANDLIPDKGAIAALAQRFAEAIRRALAEIGTPQMAAAEHGA